MKAIKTLVEMFYAFLKLLITLYAYFGAMNSTLLFIPIPAILLLLLFSFFNIKLILIPWVIGMSIVVYAIYSYIEGDE